jgi:hypothetical protein
VALAFGELALTPQPQNRTNSDAAGKIFRADFRRLPVQPLVLQNKPIPPIPIFATSPMPLPAQTSPSARGPRPDRNVSGVRGLTSPLTQHSTGPERKRFSRDVKLLLKDQDIVSSPTRLGLQDESVYFTVHHSVADTPDKADPRDYSQCVATLAATALNIADGSKRFGRRLGADEVRQMAAESKADQQWRAAGIWK